jgi:tRNA A-37 threonylcarbamoyl transferase component Bud32
MTLRIKNFESDMFNLQLKDNTIFHGEKILRQLPGKRCVVYGHCQGRAVVAKIFYQPFFAKRDWRRELLGIETLRNAQLATPLIFYQGCDYSQKNHLILFEFIPQVKNLSTFFNDQKEPERLFHIMEQVISILAHQHNVGIFQKDLHFNNFLITNDHVYTIDGASLQKKSAPLDKKQSLYNLSLFFSQLGAGQTLLQQQLFKIYSTLRNTLIEERDFIKVQQRVQAHHQNRWQAYWEKLSRTSSRFIKKVTFNKVSMYERANSSCELVEFLESPSHFLLSQEKSILKKGRTAIVSKISMGSQWVVVKHYRAKSLQHWLRRSFRGTRAAQSWKLGHCLKLFGINTPQPLAYVEEHLWGLRNQSYLLMEYIPGQNMLDFFRTNATDLLSTHKIIDAMIQLLTELKELKFPMAI